MTTAPRPVTDDQWQRMSWHARQAWLTTATTHRRSLAADIARLADERANVKAGPPVAPRVAAVEASKRRSVAAVDERARPVHGTVILHGRPGRLDERGAQQILDELGPDPDAAAHWLELTEVIETTCPARHCVAAVDPGAHCPAHAPAARRRAA